MTNTLSERNALIVELAEADLSFRLIGERVGCSRNVVAGVVNRTLGDKRRAERAAAVKAAAPPPERDPDPHGCRWIDGDPKDKGNWSFCCAPRVNGSPWCAEHYQRVYRPREGAA